MTLDLNLSLLKTLVVNTPQMTLTVLHVLCEMKTYH